MFWKYYGNLCIRGQMRSQQTCEWRNLTLGIIYRTKKYEIDPKYIIKKQNKNKTCSHYWIQNPLIFPNIDWHCLTSTVHWLYLTVHFTDFHCTPLYPTVHFYWTALYPTVHHCTVLLTSTVPHCTPLYRALTSTVPHCTPLYRALTITVPHCTALYYEFEKKIRFLNLQYIFFLRYLFLLCCI